MTDNKTYKFPFPNNLFIKRARSPNRVFSFVFLKSTFIIEIFFKSLYNEIRDIEELICLKNRVFFTFIIICIVLTGLFFTLGCIHVHTNGDSSILSFMGVHIQVIKNLYTMIVI